LQARALELDARDGAGRARALREAVLAELAELAAAADGSLPAPPQSSPLGADLAGRVRDRLFADVAAALAPLAPDGRDAGRSPLAAWERWLVLGAALDRVERQAGRVALTTLWHGGVRDAVWNETCALVGEHHARAAWVAHIMFAWVADRADYLGDLSATLTNRENARVALR